jgi:CBS domain-containing protein
MTVEAAVAFFVNEAAHRSYPVIDPQGRLLGLVSRTEALLWQSDRGDDQTSLADAISDAAQPIAYPETPTGVVADLIVECGIGRIPIIEPGTRRVLGILSRQDLLKTRSASRHAEVGRSRPVGRKAKGKPQNAGS